MGLSALQDGDGMTCSPTECLAQWNVHANASYGLFIIEGALSFFFGLIATFVLPDFPGKVSGTAKWLRTEEERHVAVLRMQRDRTSETHQRRSVWYGLKLAVTDYRTWIYVRQTFWKPI